MKKLYNILIIVGIIIFFGIILISAISEGINENLKTIGFIVLGYLSVIIFTYGWLKRSK